VEKLRTQSQQIAPDITSETTVARLNKILFIRASDLLFHARRRRSKFGLFH
jgi:hypothetical protein